MTIITAVPKDTLPVITLFAENTGRVLEYLVEVDGLTVCRWGKGFNGFLASLQAEGIAHNSIAFNTGTKSPMWRRYVRYDSNGILITQSGWSIDETERGILITEVAKQLVLGKDLTDNTWFISDLLCGPAFCPNQLEYGKRFKMRAFLLD